MKPLFDSSPQSIAMFRERTAQAPIVHRRRRCACNAVITEKQFRQYGGCVKCWRKK